MKRLLLATTALCMGAGTAVAMDKGMSGGMSDSMGMADDMMMSPPAVTVSGDGRMGVVFDDNEDARFSSRVRVKFALAAELDNGLSAGGDIRADNASGGASGTAGKVFLSGPFGTLAMGDVDPGAKAALGHPSPVGYTEVGSLNEITYTRGATAEEPALLYTLPMMGPVQAYASVGMETRTVGTEDTYSLDPKTGDARKADKKAQEISFDTLSVGAKADLAFGDGLGTAWVGAGYEGTTVDGDDGHFLAGAGISASGFTGRLVAGTNDEHDQFGLSTGYSAGQIGVTVFYTDDTEMDGNEALGVGLSWSLGGGAHIRTGVVTDIGQGAAKDMRTADLGVTFSF